MNPRGQGPPVLSALWAPSLQMETLPAVLVTYLVMVAMELQLLAKIVQSTTSLQDLVLPAVLVYLALFLHWEILLVRPVTFLVMDVLVQQQFAKTVL